MGTSCFYWGGIIRNKKVKIGRNAAKAAKAVVKRDVFGNVVVVDIPAKIVKYVGACHKNSSRYSMIGYRRMWREF